MRAVVYGAIAGVAAAGPVGEVVKLLKNMKAETTANQKTDAETFKKLECWCKKTLADTTQGIEDAQNCIAEQQTNEESNTGTNAKKATEATNLGKDIAELRQQLEDSAAQREKEAAEFGEQEKDLIQSIGALKSAVTVLSKHNKGFLQESTTNEIRDKYGHFISKYESKLSPTQRQTMQNFLQQPSSAAYSSQSGEIFGILESMLDEMSADLSDAGKDEAAAQKAYATMKETKTQILNDKTSLMKTAKETATKAARAAQEAKEASAKCQTELETMTAMKQQAESTCEAGKTEFAERSKTVALELEAIDQAIGVLDSEDAFAAFGKTTDAALFFQRSASKLNRAKATEKVLNLLSKHQGDDLYQNFGLGRALRNIAMLLQQKGLEGQDAQFQKILNAVDEQIKAKKDLLTATTEKKDTCVENINKSEAEVASLSNEIKILESKIAQNESDIEELTKQLEEDAKEKAQITDDTKEASQTRSEQNAQYQKEMQENQAAVQLLEQAKAVLQNFYGAKAFVQQAPQFNEYNKNAGGNKVITMMDTIIGDTQALMGESRVAETAAQQAYEKQVKTNNDAVKALKAAIAEAENKKANTEAEMEENTQELKGKNESLTDEQTRNGQLHHDCDFTINNFAAITGAHQEEVDGLVQAKTIIENVIADLKG